MSDCPGPDCVLRDVDTSRNPTVLAMNWCLTHHCVDRDSVIFRHLCEPPRSVPFDRRYVCARCGAPWRYVPGHGWERLIGVA